MLKYPCRPSLSFKSDVIRGYDWAGAAGSCRDKVAELAVLSGALNPALNIVPLGTACRETLGGRGEGLLRWMLIVVSSGEVEHKF